MDPLEEGVSALVVERSGYTGGAAARAEAVTEAMQALQRGGLALILVKAGTRVRLDKPRRWWGRKERT